MSPRVEFVRSFSERESSFPFSPGQHLPATAVVHSLSPAEKKDRHDSGFSLRDLSDFFGARGDEAMKRVDAFKQNLS